MKIQAHITHHIIHLCNNRYITALRKQTAATGRRRSHGDMRGPNSGHREETLTRGHEGHKQRPPGGDAHTGTGGAQTASTGRRHSHGDRRRRSHGDRRGTNSGHREDGDRRGHRFVTIILEFGSVHRRIGGRRELCLRF